MQHNIEPIQVEGIQVTELVARNEPYSRGRSKKMVERGVMFVRIKDETVMENFLSRVAQRQGAPPRLTPAAIRKHVLPKVLEEIARKHPESRIGPSTKLHFSSKAGCSMCPCSPGFFIEGVYNWSVWVEVAPGPAPSGRAA